MYPARVFKPCCKWILSSARELSMRTIALAVLIMALPAMAQAQLTFFADPNSFTDFNPSQGYISTIGPETFEENTLGTSEETWPNDPLTYGVPNDGFPTGLDHNLTIQSNTLGGNASQASPRGTAGLYAMGLGIGYGEVSDIVVADISNDSFDIILPAVGAFRSLYFDALSIYSDPVQIQVYDQNNTLLGQANNMPASAAGNFVGLGLDLASADTIGRVNIFAPGVDWEGADNIEVYAIPEPGTLSLLTIVGLALLRRR